MSCVVLFFLLPNKITPCGIKPNPQSMLICKKASLSLGSKSILVHHISSSNSEDLYCAGEWIKFCDAMVTSKPAAFMRDQRSLFGGRRRGGERISDFWWQQNFHKLEPSSLYAKYNLGQGLERASLWYSLKSCMLASRHWHFEVSI